MWFTRLGGKEAGPFTEERLQVMLRLNQFSAMHQISRDKIRWESAAPLVRQLSQSANSADGASAAEKWLAAAQRRQAERAAADAGHSKTLNSTSTQQSQQTSAATWKNRAGAVGVRVGTKTSSASSAPAGAVSVQVIHAGKSVIDRSTGGPRILLHPVNISLSQGELTAVIGPSGSGKSTWLGLLTGRAQPTTGRITVFGRDLNREFALVKRSIAAVPQMDAFLTSLKVNTSLYYSANLRLAVNTTRVQLKSRVMTVLNSVGLHECGDRRISQLSGGQLRRLSLAQELLSDPDVLYLDEVTSGLDEQSDADIMALLRTLTESGRTIMIITHHLHNLHDNCHKLVVLAKGGYLVFFGSPDEACRSFNAPDVTEILQIVKDMNPAEVADRCQAASGAIAGGIPPVPDNSPKPPPVIPRRPARHLHDFFVLVRRHIAVLISSPLSTLMSLFICATIGLLLFMSFPDLREPKEPKELSKKAQETYVENMAKCASENGNVVFILTISAFFLGCLAGTRELVMERRLFWRESGTEMSIASYLASKLLVQSILTSVQASGLGVAVVRLIKAQCSPVQVGIACGAVSISGLCTGFLISAASQSEAVATKMMLMAVLPQMILSGALHKKPPAAMKLLSQVCITSHYAFQNMCGLFPEKIRPPFKPQYSTEVVIAMALLHSAVMLGATAYFLRQTATGEDPVRGE